MNRTRKPRRRPGVPIPTLREALPVPGEYECRGPLPIIAFKDGPSKRYLTWLDHAYAGNPEKRANLMGVGPLYRRIQRLVIADPWHFPPTSHDWVPAAPGFPPR